MDFGTIVSKITGRVARPDRLEDAQDAVNDAIEFCTVNGDFSNDLVEGSEAIDSSLYTQSLVISTTFTRFRKIKYLRPEDYTRFLTWTDPKMIFDDRHNACTDVWYRAGDNIVFKLSSLQDTMKYGYYQFPARLTLDADTHWMLDYMYSAVFNLACADIWDSVGNSEEAARFKKKGDDFFLAHRRDHADGVLHT